MKIQKLRSCLKRLLISVTCSLNKISVTSIAVPAVACIVFAVRPKPLFLKTQLTIAIILLQCMHLYAQVIADSGYAVRVRDINPRYIRIKDSLYAASGICKTLRVWKPVTGPATSSQHSRRSLFSIHGNVQYDFLYRSFSDTPYYQKDFRQHTLRTQMTITVKDNVPVQLNLVLRKSNSPYFRDFFDGGVILDRLALQRNLKEELIAKITGLLPDKRLLEQQLDVLAKRILEYENLRNRLNTSGLVQELIEERERNYLNRLKNPVPGLSGVSVLTDTLTGDLERTVKKKKAELDSLKSGIEKLRDKADSLDRSVRNIIASVQQRISKAGSAEEIDRISKEYGISEKKEKWKKFAADIKSAGIGRSVIQYSELTARDVSLTGVNLEYNNRIYFAFAAGKIDYGFRDFFGRNSRQNGQHLVMGRIGFGDAGKRAVIFSVFTGRKAPYGSIIQDSVTGHYPVLGYSVETILKKDEKTFISAEIAKSTKAVTGSITGNKAAGSLFRFSDNSNLGLSVKGQTYLTSTRTAVSGFFRKTGEHYQSFSLFSYNTDQTAWMLRVDQPLLKNRINISGTVRKNDFVNPFTEKTFKTSTLFGSGHLSIRFPKWPSVTAGYQPGSQLYIIDRNRVRENVYYMFNATVLHQYKLLGSRMVSSVMYSNYRSKGTDSGFINYNGRYYFLSQSVYFRKVNIQTNYIYTDQQEMSYYTLEGSTDISIGQRVRTGAGIKYNKIHAGSTCWGGTAYLSLDLLRLGNLQLQYDKSFLPTIYRDLFPVEMGRLTWFKNF